MSQRGLFPPERIPAYGETKAEAYAKLKASGRDLVQDERVRLAIAYLAPCTRETLYDWLATPSVPGLLPMKASSVSRSVNSLIKGGKVRAIGKTEGRYGSKVEVLSLGIDERIIRKKGRLLEQAELPTMELTHRQPMPPWYAAFIVGFCLGGAFVMVLYAVILF